MQGSWRVIIIDPDHNRAVSLSSRLAADERFLCRAFTHVESALEFLSAETQDIAIVSPAAAVSQDTSLAKIIHEHQAHLPIITMFNEDHRDETPNDFVNSEKVDWPNSTEGLVTALEEVLDIPIVPRNCSIGIPFCLDDSGLWSEDEEDQNFTQTICSMEKAQPAGDTVYSFACCWIENPDSSISAEVIDDQLRSMNGRVKNLLIDKPLVGISADVPRSVDLNEVIRSLIGESSAYLLCLYPQTLDEVVLEKFIRFVDPHVVETLSMETAFR